VADSAVQPSPEGLLVYLNLAQGIRMKYPNTWQKQEETGPMGFLVAFLSPLEDPFDRFSENVNLIVAKLPMPATLEQFVRYAYDQAMQLGAFTVLEGPTKDQLGNLPAYRMVYTGQLPGDLSGKYLVYLALNGDRAYTLTYTAQAGKYEKFLGNARQIAASLEAK
jgi:hypothetical protein